MEGVRFSKISINNDDRQNPSFSDSSLHNLTFISQNVNSLNLSTHDQSYLTCNKFLAKINDILQNKPNIVLLQDLRLNSKSDLLEKELKCNQFGNYACFLNSQMNCRGTGILLNGNLDYKIFNVHKSQCNNIILLDLAINNFRLTLGSCYGPPQNGNNNFFPSIFEYITNIGNPHFIIGGDLNSVTCTSSTNNLDIFNMTTIPNPIHSRHLNQLITNGIIVDVFRILNPNLKDFSYVPFAAQKINRSRIDLILASSNLLQIFDEMTYKANKIKIFDHKSAIVKTKSNIKRIPSVNNSLLNLPGLFECIQYEIYALILDHFALDNALNLKNSLISINNLSREATNLSNSNFFNDKLVRFWHTERETAINRLCSEFPPINDMYSFECNISPDLFWETLINRVSNTCISFQSNYVREKNKVKYDLSKELFSLKTSGNLNEHKITNIFLIEEKLSMLEDEENIKYVENSKYFNILNSEKASRPFSKLLNKLTNCEVLTNLKDDNNQTFKSLRDRDNYLLEKFKLKFETQFNPTCSVVEFMGEYANHPLVNQHKLSLEQKNLLDRPITLEELDLSLKSSNINSSPGYDNVSIKLLNEFWPFLRLPYLKALNFMIDQGKLSARMRQSKIKLIKKNNSVDSSRITNLRPIGNLTSTYKLFSGCIALRLQSVTDTVIHRSQKAYSNKNCIQEGLFYTYELISKTLNNNSSLSCLSLDFSSAFDRISHDYLIDALKFFNFGDFFISLVKLTLTDRFAVISTPQGITDFFQLKIGSTQGDRPSPDLFKIGLNPLQLRIVLSKEVKLPRELPFKLKHSDKKPDNISAFADDGIIFSIPNVISLRFCVRTLQHFSSLSGLNINNRKTKVCIIGHPPDNNYTEYCNEIGFQIVNSFTMLGIEFHSRQELMEQNWDKVISKMNKIVNFWSIFNLSPPGKINIVKCFILAQLNYVGSVLNPSERNIITIENLILSFLNQNCKISKEKLFSPIEQGGFGLPNVRCFLKSLDLLMYKKSLSINDTWATEMQNCALNDQFYFIENIDRNSSPILHRIIHSVIDFQTIFWIKNKNLRDMRIFGNIHFVNHELIMISREIFTLPTWARFNDKIKSLKFKDVINNNNQFLNFYDFRLSTEIDLSLNEYFRLQSICRFSIEKYRNNLGGKQSSLESIFRKQNVKSKYFRTFIEREKFHIDKTTTTKNRYLWANFDIDIERELRWQKMWSLSFLPMEIKNFAFRLLNNQHKLNSHRFYYTENQSQECTLCNLANIRPSQKESLKHFFIDCNVTENFARNYFDKFFEHLPINFDSNWFFLGSPLLINQKVTFIINIELILVSFFILKCRNKKILPVARNLEHFILLNRNLLKRSAKYKKFFSIFSNPYDPG